MSRHTTFLLLPGAVLMMLAAASAVADGPASAAPDTVQVVDPVAAPVIDTRLAREVREVQADFNRRLAGLTERYQATSDQTLAATIQEEIVHLKQDLEVQMLTVQLREARRRGETVEADLIAELQQAIAIVEGRQGRADDQAAPQAQEPRPATPAGAAR